MITSGISIDAIRTEGLTKRFGDITAVDGLSLRVGQGELFGLIGADGAGKTTTLRMLAGIMDPSEGEAWVLGRHTIRDSEPMKNEIGYMSQRFGLYPDLTVLENLHFYADIFGVDRRERAIATDRLLEFSNLAPFARRQAGKLSGGMKQKLGLACALIHTPRVLLLDEPTNGVDPVSRRDFWHILSQLLRDGITILVSTSYLDEADRCDRVGLLHRGKLFACGTPEQLKSRMEVSILQIQCNDNRRAARLLGELLKDCLVGLFGDRIHVITPEPASTETRLRNMLAEASLELRGIQPIAPSLEDLFLTRLTREQNQ